MRYSSSHPPRAFRNRIAKISSESSSRPPLSRPCGCRVPLRRRPSRTTQPTTPASSCTPIRNRPHGHVDDALVLGVSQAGS